MHPPTDGCGSGDHGPLEPELLEAPRAGAARVVADQLPALAAEPVEHRVDVTLLAFHPSARQLDADSGLLALRVIGGDDRGVLPGGHPRTVAGAVPAGGPWTSARSSGTRRSAISWCPLSSGWMLSDQSPGSCGSVQSAVAGFTNGRPAPAAASATASLIQSMVASVVPGL